MCFMYLLFCFIWEEGYTFLYDFVNVKLVEKKRAAPHGTTLFSLVRKLVYFCTFTSMVMVLASVSNSATLKIPFLPSTVIKATKASLLRRLAIFRSTSLAVLATIRASLFIASNSSTVMPLNSWLKRVALRVSHSATGAYNLEPPVPITSSLSGAVMVALLVLP